MDKILTFIYKYDIVFLTKTKIKMTVYSLLAIIPGLIIGNFLYQLFNKQDYKKAFFVSISQVVILGSMFLYYYYYRGFR